MHYIKTFKKKIPELLADKGVAKLNTSRVMEKYTMYAYPSGIHSSIRIIKFLMLEFYCYCRTNSAAVVT